MFLRLQSIVSAILKDNNKAQVEINKEIDILENWHRDRITTRCTYSFMAGAIISAIMYGLVFAHMSGRSIF